MSDRELILTLVRTARAVYGEPSAENTIAFHKAVRASLHVDVQGLLNREAQS